MPYEKGTHVKRHIRMVLVSLTAFFTVVGLQVLSPGLAHADSGQGVAATATSQLGNMCGSYPGACSVEWCAVFAKWVWNQHSVQNTNELNSAAISFYAYGV